MTIRKILVPIDFSQGSQAATDVAVELARTLGARVTLLHVAAIPSSILPDGGTVLAATQLAALEASTRTLLDHTRARVSGAGVEVDARTVCGGSPWTEICREAKEGAHDLIAVGTHGRTGLAHALVGSVAERVVRHAPCPVLTVKAKSSLSARA